MYYYEKSYTVPNVSGENKLYYTGTSSGTSGAGSSRTSGAGSSGTSGAGSSGTSGAGSSGTSGAGSSGTIINQNLTFLGDYLAGGAVIRGGLSKPDNTGKGTFNLYTTNGSTITYMYKMLTITDFTYGTQSVNDTGSGKLIISGNTVNKIKLGDLLYSPPISIIPLPVSPVPSILSPYYNLSYETATLSNFVGTFFPIPGGTGTFVWSGRGENYVFYYTMIAIGQFRYQSGTSLGTGFLNGYNPITDITLIEDTGVIAVYTGASSPVVPITYSPSPPRSFSPIVI
jgi:hypothetical protein